MGLQPRSAPITPRDLADLALYVELGDLVVLTREEYRELAGIRALERALTERTPADWPWMKVLRRRLVKDWTGPEPARAA